jgi:hypothetical protein
MARLRELWIRLRRGSQTPESRPETDEEEYQDERKRELLRNSLEEAQRREFTQSS